MHLRRLNMNNGIINKNGSISFAQVVSGNNNNVKQDHNTATVYENIGNAEEIISIKDLLDELNSELSKHKLYLDKLSNKVSIIEDELEEKNPNKEKIKRNLKDSLSTVHQFTGAINNLNNILNIIHSHFIQ
jgi:chromosome segregation ATPase